MIDKNVLYNEDCLDTMARIGKKAVGLVVTSPPYNTSRKGSSLDYIGKSMANIRYDDFDDCRSDEDYMKWTIDIFNGFDNVLIKDGCVLYNLSYSSENTHLMWMTISEIMLKTNFIVADNIIWKKPTTSPNSCSPNKLTRIFEYIFVFCRKSEFNTFHCNKTVSSLRKSGQKSYNNIFNLIEAPNNDGATDIHKATFSSLMVRKLLRLYGRKGTVVYDPFMGTGTTAVACIEEGFDYIGSEISKRYIDYSKKRISYCKNQLKMF